MITKLIWAFVIGAISFNLIFCFRRGKLPNWKLSERESKFKSLANSFWQYFFETNHPIVMILYIVIGPLFYLYGNLTYIIPMANIIPSYIMISFHCFAWLGFYAYYKSVTVCPGFVNKENCEELVERFSSRIDFVTNRAGATCSTCLISRLVYKARLLSSL